MAVKGIDVSKWQGDVDFGKVKSAGYKFVMINAGYGRYISQKDKCFDKNYSNAKSVGLNVGAYWYSYAVNAAQAEAEAKVFLEAVKGREFEYPLAMDIEDAVQQGLSNAVVGDIINAFCSYLESNGCYAAIYSYADFLKNKVPAECRKKYDVWVAHFDVDEPAYSDSYGMWQYSSTGKVNGVNGNCDLDYSYKDYPALIKEKGLNGYGKSQKILDSAGWKTGDKDRGVLALKQMLILAKDKKLIDQKLDDNEIFGEGTQKAVNELLEKWDYSANGIAGDNFIRKLRESLK